MKCSHCQLENRQGVHFCTRCGTPLVAICPLCRAPSAADDLYCGECGARLPSGVRPPAMTPAPSSQLPAAVKPQMESERKNVTVLFADISGFTAMSEKMDPEEVTNIMNGCMKMLADIVHRYEGYVDKFIGDCIMALFGAPVTHENDPELALRAALDMQKEMEEYNASLQGRLETPLTLHTGINSGMVIAGGVGSDKKMEYTVMGDTVNLAARLESLARNGQTFVSGYTYNLTRNLFEFVRHEPIKVKGKKDPVAVYELVRAKSRVERDSDLARESIPLVGRNREMETLRACLDRHTTGQGLVVFLISPAGVGKSRIHQEIKKQYLKGDRIQVLEGTCRSFSRETSYAVFIELFRQLLNIDSEDLHEAMADKLTQNLPLLLGLDPEEIHAEETRKGLVFIGALLGLKLGAEFDIPLERMNSQEIKLGIFRACGWFFHALAARKPLILSLEDIHYADPTSVELIASLLERVKQAPILLLLLMRPFSDHPSSKLPLIADKELDDLATEIHFKHLSPAECDELTRQLLRSDDVPEPILQLVRSRADGNPMFIEEIVRNLLDEGIVAINPDGAPRVIKNLDEVSIPSSIQGIFIARIDKLATEYKEILLAASVIGPVFRLALLQRLFPGTELEPKLAQLGEMNVIFESKSFPEIEYSFRNILIQEAIYSTLLLKKRRELHAAVAAEIEDLYANRLEDHHEVLAQHYLRAEIAPQAYFHLVKSGLKAKETHANSVAASALERALELGKGLTDPPLPLAETAVALSEVRELAGEFSAAIAIRQWILTAMEDPKARIEHLRRIGRLHEKMDDYPQAMAVYEQAHQELQGQPDSMDLGMLLMNESWILNRMGQRDEAALRARRALAIFEAHNAQERIAMVCNNLGVILEHQGDLELALAFNRKSLKIFMELGDKRQTANLYLSMGFLHEKNGALEEALQYFEHSHEIMTRIENPFGAGTALMRMGICLSRLNRLAEAEKALREALKLHRQLGLTRKVVSNLWTLCELHLAMGAASKARNQLEEARQIAAGRNDLPDLAQCALLEARVQVQEKRDPDTAYQEAIRLFSAIGRHDAAEAAGRERERHSRQGTTPA
ncbi:MAG: tetratricopeptide repeat protein [Magnetococcales bacterium]|nr:tetratricopeptide repeat protein [Magnetococcales bacterium]